MSNLVTRFAPSPTGYLHVGGARTALFNWLLARHTGGRCLLRIEDTDLARSTQRAVDQLVEDLHWLGLHWDNPELVHQSRRLPLYNKVIDLLISRGLAYKAFETDEELDALRSAAEREKRQYRYRRPNLPDADLRRFEAEGRPHVVRFAMPHRDFRFDDAVLGPNQGVAAAEVQDFVIRKSDGMPTYHFAVVVDDEEMGVTHVLRGQEHLLNTVNHIALQEALGYPRPVYAHLSVILNPQDGSKMGKRDRDKKVRQRAHEWMKSAKKSVDDLAAGSGIPSARIAAWLKDDKSQLDPSEHALLMPLIGLKASDMPEILVHDFRKAGYFPEALLNFLALLGWSPGQDRERMSFDQMVELFSLENVGRANARFNREKLLAFNTEFAAAAPPGRLLRGFREYLASNPDSPLNAATDAQLLALLDMKKGFRLLREVDEISRFLFAEDGAIAYAPDAVEKFLRKNNSEGAEALRALRPILAAIAPNAGPAAAPSANAGHSTADVAWNAAAIERAVNAFCAERNIPLKAVAQPLRVAVSGSAVSPPIFQTLEFLGRQGALARIDRCLSL